MPNDPEAPTSGSPARDDAFWRAHHGVGLVWSNPRASDSVMIMHALLQPNFHLLLDIAVRFGLDRLRDEWAALQADSASFPFPDEARARSLRYATPIVTRSIAHIEEAWK